MIRTNRLELVPATPQLIEAALQGPVDLGQILGARVPDTWPPEYLDAPAFRYTLDKLNEGRAHEGWWMYFVLLPQGPGAPWLIGTSGYKGPPDAEGSVEVGYGIVADQRRKGYATEATRALIARAFADPRVTRVIAETFPELVASQGVMANCGLKLEGDGSEPGVIRFTLPRSRWSTGEM